MEQVDSIVRDIIDIVASNGVNNTSIQEMIDVLNDETITNKTTSIAEILEVGKYNTEQIRKVLAQYNLK